MQLELIVHERALNALGFRQPRRDSRESTPRRSIEREAVAARFLRFVHGEIGCRENLRARATVEQRDADTGCDRNLALGQDRRQTRCPQACR